MSRRLARSALAASAWALRLAKEDGWKTRASLASRRKLPLRGTAAAVLREHRATQLEERMKAANVWTDTGHVFTTETGRPMDPRNVLRAITTAAKKAGVAGVNVHTLRHSAATHWLENGVHLKAVSDLLGHSSTRITGDVYAHTSDDAANLAMDVLGEALGK